MSLDWVRRFGSCGLLRLLFGSGADVETHEDVDEDNDPPILTLEEQNVLMALMDHHISLDFILEMKEAFQLFDKNGDGYISAKELGVLMRTLGRNPTEDEILNMINEIDLDHNGKLDFSEFTLMMKEKLTGDDMAMEIQQAFRVFDTNGDGFISKTEFKHCMMNFGERFSDKEIEEMMAEADTNKDGNIDYHEFANMILNEIGDTNTNNTNNDNTSSSTKRTKKTSTVSNTSNLSNKQY